MSTKAAAGHDAARYAARRLGMIVGKLFRVMRRRFACFPDDYLVVDLETTGLSKTEDLIGQIGYCIVKDRKPVLVKGTVLNWFRHPGVPHAWLNKRLETAKYQVEHDRKTGMPNGRHYHLSHELMMKEGEDPVVCLAACLDLLKKARSSDRFVIAHNGYNFDCPFLENSFRRWLGSAWKFGDSEVFDTGMTEKANQLNLLPWDEENLRQFSERIGRQIAQNVFWNLDQHCVQKYGLAQKYGLNPSTMHEAGQDCLAAHYLFEEFRKLAEEFDAPNKPSQGPVELRRDPGEGDPFPADSRD